MKAATLELRIEKVVNGGEGLARVAGADGRKQVYFVPFTLPGELVRVEPGGGGGRARLVEVLEASPERVAPGCEYFGRCGGCQLQQASERAQIEIKREILIESLRRLGGVVWEGAITVHGARTASEAWGYRNRVRLHRAAEGGWGYFEAGSQRVLAIARCPIAAPAINAALAELPREGQEIELSSDGSSDRARVGGGAHFAVGEFRYQASAGAFFQVNRFLTPELVEVATAGAAEGDAAALDLYSGVGLFALPLARTWRVEAVEGHPAAFADLRHNAAGVGNLKVIHAATLDYLRRARGPYGLAVADPPRAGLGSAVCEALVKLAPARLHLVSCDPATLARDLGALLDGGYSIEEVHLFDLFPQTHHLETVVKLRRK